MDLKHDAVFYSGDKGFVDLIGGFMADAIRAGEPVMAMVAPNKIEWLQQALGRQANRAHFVDMSELGRNPARIIPAWRSFLASSQGVSARGIGEPIWAARSPQELIEAQRHEELINLALADGPCWLICPYDESTLDQETLEHANESHPTLYDGTSRSSSVRYRGLDDITRPMRRPLPEPDGDVLALDFSRGPLSGVRTFVKSLGRDLGLDTRRVENLVIAVGEIAANSIRHGGGSGRARIWRDANRVVCEVSDAGTIHDPLAGRVRPSPEDEGGYGLWLANQLCDLVQIRSSDSGTTVRIHIDVGIDDLAAGDSVETRHTRC